MHKQLNTEVSHEIYASYFGKYMYIVSHMHCLLLYMYICDY